MKARPSRRLEDLFQWEPTGKTKFVLISLAWLFLLFYRFYVFMKLWDYIAVPIGAPHIGVGRVFGFGIMFSILNDSNSETRSAAPLEKIKTIAMKLFTAWLLGYFFFGRFL